MNYSHGLLKPVWVVFYLLLIGIFILFFFFFLSKNPTIPLNQTLTPTPYQSTHPSAFPTIPSQLQITPAYSSGSPFISDNGITPNKSTTEDVKTAFGLPADITVKNNFTVLKFTDSLGGVTTDTVYTSDTNSVTYVLHQYSNNNTLYKDFISQTKENPSETFYSTDTLSTNLLWYVFPDKGLAFMANNQSGNTLRILYFPPMSINDFVNTVAPVFGLKQGIRPQGDNVETGGTQ